MLQGYLSIFLVASIVNVYVRAESLGEEIQQQQFSRSRKLQKEIHDGEIPQQVADVRSMPWSAIGRLIVSDCPDLQQGESRLCTAPLIGPHTALTAAHCMFTQAGWCKKYKFETADSTVVKVIQVGIRSCWKNGDNNCDVSLISLANDVGLETGFFTIHMDCSNDFKSQVSIAGYPLDKGGEQMYVSQCDDVVIQEAGAQAEGRLITN
eukprot:TRINITY_DN57275_c0_g1_i1.p1 TRINITY_DN57275_c0_g1~~TRINITY_DN57275_c0_g1_i1.p1  ORF type:complete len:208 (-),score=14.40 TRINITY_DN57275_c0_g1_i1:36-659(-)